MNLRKSAMSSLSRAPFPPPRPLPEADRYSRPGLVGLGPAPVVRIAPDCWKVKDARHPRLRHTVRRNGSSFRCNCRESSSPATWQTKLANRDCDHIRKVLEFEAEQLGAVAVPPVPIPTAAPTTNHSARNTPFATMPLPPERDAGSPSRVSDTLNRATCGLLSDDFHDSEDRRRGRVKAFRW